MILLPAKEGTCPICARSHHENEPHDKTSLFYQYRFYSEHGRWATWEDAMEHCTEEMKSEWRRELIALGEI
jgi:hypothetical protein